MLSYRWFFLKRAWKKLDSSNITISSNILNTSSNICTSGKNNLFISFRDYLCLGLGQIKLNIMYIYTIYSLFNSCNLNRKLVSIYIIMSIKKFVNRSFKLGGLKKINYLYAINTFL